MFLSLVLLACAPANVKLTDDTAGGSDLDDDTGGDSGGDSGEVVDTADSGGDSGDSGGDSGDSGSDSGDSGEDTSQWDDATLVVLSPSSGAFLPYGEPAHFEAVVYDGDGHVLDFDDVSWSSDIDAAWSGTGASFDDATLDVGVHTLTATARLPNGDRLAYAVGGVLVQSELTGIYTGTLTIDLTVQGYTGTCSGGATLLVDAYGDQVTGDAACVLSVAGYDLATNWLFDYSIAEGGLDGVAGADLTWFTYDFDSSGAITNDGELSGDWEDDVYGVLTVAGDFAAERVSRELPTE